MENKLKRSYDYDQIYKYQSIKRSKIETIQFDSLKKVVDDIVATDENMVEIKILHKTY